MSTIQIVLIVSIAVAALGLIIELSSGRRNRFLQNDSGNRPSVIHRNFHLTGKFNYKFGLIRYQCFCLGPFIFVPVCCFSCDKHHPKSIMSAQKMKFLEIFALYSRWGWIIAIIALLCMI